MKRYALTFAICALCGVLLLSGCPKGNSRAKGNPSMADAQTKTSSAKIAYLTFSLPEQINWEQNSDPNLDRMGTAEWYMAGTTPQTTPARVMYQKIAPVLPPAELKDRLLKPLEKCPDSKVSEWKSSSRYSPQTTFEAICSKFGDENFGLISYLSFYSDDEATHLVLAEVRTPASAKAGSLPRPKTAAGQRAAEMSKALSVLLKKAMHTIRVCDEKGLCL